MSNKIYEILKNTFGFDKFLPHQEDIIKIIRFELGEDDDFGSESIGLPR